MELQDELEKRLSSLEAQLSQSSPESASGAGDPSSSSKIFLRRDSSSSQREGGGDGAGSAYKKESAAAGREGGPSEVKPRSVTRRLSRGEGAEPSRDTKLYSAAVRRQEHGPSELDANVVPALEKELIPPPPNKELIPPELRYFYDGKWDTRELNAAGLQEVEKIVYDPSFKLPDIPEAAFFAKYIASKLSKAQPGVTPAQEDEALFGGPSDEPKDPVSGGGAASEDERLPDQNEEVTPTTPDEPYDLRQTPTAAEVVTRESEALDALENNRRLHTGGAKAVYEHFLFRDGEDATSENGAGGSENGAGEASRGTESHANTGILQHVDGLDNGKGKSPPRGNLLEAPGEPKGGSALPLLAVALVAPNFASISLRRASAPANEKNSEGRVRDETTIFTRAGRRQRMMRFL